MPVNFNDNTLFEQGVFELEALVGFDYSSRLRSQIESQSHHDLKL